MPTVLNRSEMRVVSYKNILLAYAILSDNGKRMMIMPVIIGISDQRNMKKKELKGRGLFLAVSGTGGGRQSCLL